jgi:hypothetical protein
MNQFMISEKFESIKADQLFNAGRTSLIDLGMEIIKDRSIAFLLQARTITEEVVINANFIVNAIQKEFSIILTSEIADLKLLKGFAERFIKTLKTYLEEQ